MEPTSQETTRGQVSWGRLLTATAVAAVAAAALNAVIFLIASALDLIPDDVEVSTPNGEGPIEVGMVIGASIFGAIMGGVIYAIMTRLTNRAVTIFTIVAIIAGLLSLSSPLGIDAPTKMIATLILMHIVATAVIIGVLTTYARPLPSQR